MHRQTFLSETLINKLSAAHYYYHLGYESRIGWMEDLEWRNYFIADCQKLFSEFLHCFQKTATYEMYCIVVVMTCARRLGRLTPAVLCHVSVASSPGQAQRAEQNKITPPKVNTYTDANC